MKKGLLVLGIIACISLVSGIIYYNWATAGCQTMLRQPQGQMEWLRQEFHLSDVQFRRISDLHAAYRPRCDQMCQRIADADAKLSSLISGNKSLTPEVDAALQSFMSVRAECSAQMLKHLYAVAAEMSPADAERYLAMMKPRIVTPSSESMVTISSSGQ